MLTYTTSGHITDPALIFLHGFLGSGQDWNDVIAHLSPSHFCVAIDLPGHGQSTWVDNWHLAILEIIHSLPLIKPTLIGYSMGGRLAVQLSNLTNSLSFLCMRYIILSAHLGLTTEKEKQERWATDLHWAQLIETNFSDFLNQWYQQPLFATLPPSILQPLLLQRQQGNPKNLAKALLHMSLSCQTTLCNSTPYTFFLYGKKDLKYQQLYANLPNCYVIEEAGHAAHIENPFATATMINTILGDLCY